MQMNALCEICYTETDVMKMKLFFFNFVPRAFPFLINLLWNEVDRFLTAIFFPIKFKPNEFAKGALIHYQ